MNTTHPQLAPSRARRAVRPRQEGAALLIVLFILMMSTATAVYAMQSTQFEQRAAGSLQQAMRTRYISEAATNGVISMCEELGYTGCLSMKLGDFTATQRQMYGLPDRGTVETLTSVTVLDYVSSTWPNPSGFVNPILPSDAELIDTTTNAGGSASPFQPNFMLTAEQWMLPKRPGDSRFPYRLVVSTFGHFNLGTADADATATDFRGAHESVSATRAFIDLR